MILLINKRTHSRHTPTFYIIQSLPPDWIQLTAENANEKNLITGTRYLNVEECYHLKIWWPTTLKKLITMFYTGLLQYLMEIILLQTVCRWKLESVEDNGDGILFNVFCYNVQPGINIDYATGDSSLSGESTDVSADTANTEYVLNVNTKKFHKPTCSAAKQMKEENKQEYSGSRDDLIAQGYEPCKKCNP